MLSALAVPVLATVPGPVVALAVQETAIPADAYADAGAREIVRLGRERRNSVDRSIVRYTAGVQERMSAGLRMGGIERILFRRETAARIDWRSEGPVRIDVLGARETLPIFMKGVQVPAGLEEFMPHLAFDPVDPEVFIRLDTTFLRHPLAAGAESHYRYRSGDTTVIRLADGRDIRLLELVVTPRRDDVHLLSGSFWFDEDTHAIVRAVFRPARAQQWSAYVVSMRAELTYITIEYGLWELRWWMPRVIAAEGVFQASRIAMPLSYERRYSDYTVEGDTLAATLPADSTATRPCRPQFRMTVSMNIDPGADSARSPVADSVRRARQEARERERAERRAENPDLVAADECIESFDVVIADSSALLDSEYLPPSVWDGGGLLTESELAELAELVDRLPRTPWLFRPSSFAFGPRGAGLLRYNRVEALSIGAAATLDLGRLTVSAEARIGTADLEPNGEVSVGGVTPGGQRRLTAYRRLTAANPDTRPFATGNSMNALVLGRDDGAYFRTIGVELTLAPELSASQWYDIRLYGEHQKRASTETDFSLRHLVDDDHVFGATIDAARADQFGASLTLRTSGGIDPASVRWGIEGGATAETGTFGFVKPWALVRTTLPVGNSAFSVELASGTSTGDVPVQSAWYLGGPGTLRGYGGAVASGDSFWRARTELSRGPPAIRLTLFSDLGWAGPRAAFGTRDALVSAGLGFSFLDGLVRFDLARALEPPTGWRFDFHVSRSF